MRRTKIALMTLVINFLFACGNNPGSPASPLLGSFFDGLTNQINGIIQQAQNSGLVLEVNAGSQAKNLIEQVRIAYDGEMNKTFDSFTTAQQKTFDDLSAAIAQVNNGVTKDVYLLGNTMSMLPFMRRVPQIHFCEGNVITTANDDVIIHLKGYFWDLATPGYKATMIVGGQKIDPLISNATDLEFRLPAYFKKNPVNAIDYLPVKVEVDYQIKKLGIITKKLTAHFDERIVILPKSFGSFALQTTTLVDTTYFERQTCPNLTWNTHSGSDDNTVKGCTMEPGWTCDVNSVEPIKWRNEEGRMNVDWFNLGSASQPSFAGWHYNMTTKHGPRGNYGGGTIDLQYTRFRTAKVDKTVVTPAKILNWGDKIVLDLPRGCVWKLIFKKYNGTTFEIASTNQQSPYIQIRNISNRQLELDAVPYDL